MAEPPEAATSGAPHCVIFRNGQPARGPRDLRQISELLKQSGTLVWFDVVDPGSNDLALLQEEFHLHPLAIEDAVQAHQRPKIESYPTYWFVVVSGVTSTDSAVQFHEIAIFAGERFLVTVRHAPPYPLDEIEQRWQAHPASLRQDSGFLLYTILDTIVDGYFPVTEEIEERLNALQNALFGEGRRQSEVFGDIFRLQKDVQHFRRAALPMRDILNPIIRGDLQLFTAEELLYYRDVYDHAIRVIDQLDAVRDQVSNALNIQLSVVANRQGEINKQLTLIATVFLPLSFITGFFGQNFGYLVTALLPGEGTFWIVGIGSEVVTCIVLVIYFKRKGWF